ncbi:hypothetical protein ACWCWQ_01870 [Streptomyces sp. NPDC001571]
MESNKIDFTKNGDANWYPDKEIDGHKITDDERESGLITVAVGGEDSMPASLGILKEKDGKASLLRIKHTARNRPLGGVMALGSSFFNESEEDASMSPEARDYVRSLWVLLNTMYSFTVKHVPGLDDGTTDLTVMDFPANSLTIGDEKVIITPIERSGQIKVTAKLK